MTTSHWGGLSHLEDFLQLQTYPHPKSFLGKSFHIKSLPEKKGQPGEVSCGREPDFLWEFHNQGAATKNTLSHVHIKCATKSKASPEAMETLGI